MENTSIQLCANQITDGDLRDRTLETDSKELDFPAHRLTAHRLPTVTSRPFGSLPSQAFTIYIYHRVRPFRSPALSRSLHSSGVRVLVALATATHRIMIIRVLRCHKGKQCSGEGNSLHRSEHLQITLPRILLSPLHQGLVYPCSNLLKLTFIAPYRCIKRDPVI